MSRSIVVSLEVHKTPYFPGARCKHHLPLQNLECTYLYTCALTAEAFPYPSCQQQTS